METCFGAENVNVDGDADFENCAATPAYQNDDASTFFEKLPGCNPIQSGPADATVVTGADCSATAAPTTGGNQTSTSAPVASQTPADAMSSPAVTSSAEKPSPTSTADSYSSIAKDDISAMPSVTLSLPSKQNEPAPTGSADEVDATSTAAPMSYDLPSLSLASTAKPADHTGAPSAGSPSGEEECTTPVTITVTPTVYVTAGSDATSCGLGTIYQTVTETATVTVSA